MDLEPEAFDDELSPIECRSKVVAILIEGVLSMRRAPPSICGNNVLNANSGLELVSESLLSVSDSGVTRGDTDSQLTRTQQEVKRTYR